MKLSLFIVAAALAAGPASAVSYLPVGPQLNVALSAVIGGGWKQCYSATMDISFGISAASTLAGCTGSRLLVAGRETGSSTFLVLAQARKIDVLFTTGINSGLTHNANGTEWYNANEWSFGFAPGGETVNKLQCDLTVGLGRMCVHTFDDVGGYSINGVEAFDTNFEKLVFTNSAVPEPASWAMLIAGFGLIGATQRRRRLALAA